jgi:putative transposase
VLTTPRNTSTAHFCAWVGKQNIIIAQVQPGPLQQNAYIERYNLTVRQEWLGWFAFDTVTEVRDHATRWLPTYNNDRPDKAIGGITPRQQLEMAP